MTFYSLGYLANNVSSDNSLPAISKEKLNNRSQSPNRPTRQTTPSSKTEKRNDSPKMTSKEIPCEQKSKEDLLKHASQHLSVDKVY